MKFIDLVGERIGRLVVLERSGKSKDGSARFLCKCDCGKTKIIHGGSLRGNHTKSCGCLNVEVTKITNTRHGYSPFSKKRVEYTSWLTMRQRCGNPNNHKYKDYGARGIVICERWNDFKNFIEDMGDRPTPRHSIDRIDVNGNYSPENCRWALPSTQARNIRTYHTNISGQNGVLWSADNHKWRSSISLNRKNKHIGYFDDLNEAIEARKNAEIKYWGKESS